MRSALKSAVVALAVFAIGCGGGPKRVTGEVKLPPGIDRAKAILKDYENGAPFGSEEVSYKDIIEDIRKTDPAKADMLKKGLEDMHKPGADVKAKAKELLGKM